MKILDVRALNYNVIINNCVDMLSICRTNTKYKPLSQ